jgi:hypothetical protein
MCSILALTTRLVLVIQLVVVIFVSGVPSIAADLRTPAQLVAYAKNIFDKHDTADVVALLSTPGIPDSAQVDSEKQTLSAYAALQVASVKWAPHDIKKGILEVKTLEIAGRKYVADPVSVGDLIITFQVGNKLKDLPVEFGIKNGRYTRVGFVPAH